MQLMDSPAACAVLLLAASDPPNAGWRLLTACLARVPEPLDRLSGLCALSLSKTDPPACCWPACPDAPRDAKLLIRLALELSGRSACPPMATDSLLLRRCLAGRMLPPLGRTGIGITGLPSWSSKVSLCLHRRWSLSALRQWHQAKGCKAEAVLQPTFGPANCYRRQCACPVRA